MRCRPLLALAAGASLVAVASAVFLLQLNGAYAADSTKKRTAHIGFVSPVSSSTSFSQRYEPAFWDRLRELGWVVGQNLLVEARRADGRIEKFPELMAPLDLHSNRRGFQLWVYS